MLKSKIYVHQNIRYSFNWNLKRHKYKLNKLNFNSSPREELKRLGSFLKKVYQGQIPNELFNNKEIPRVSQFKIIGLKRGFLTSFSKKLIRAGIIKKYDSDTKLSKYAHKVYEIYTENQFKKKPGHNPILKNILIKDKDSIAIEIPIWMNSNYNCITGHIDLIQFDNNVVKVIDYKPEGNFLASMPQVATYGLLIKKLLKLNHLKCNSFNRFGAWEYDPIILITHIKEFLINQGIKTRIWENFIK